MSSMRDFRSVGEIEQLQEHYYFSPKEGGAGAEAERAMNELQETRRWAEQANMRQTKAIASRSLSKVAAMDTELTKLKESLKLKDIQIKSLKDNVSLDEQDTKSLSRRICELEGQVEKQKKSEIKLRDSILSQTKQLEETRFSLEESNFEVVSLRHQLDNIEGGNNYHHGNTPSSNISHGNIYSMKDEMEFLKSEVQYAKDNLVRVQESEKISSAKVKETTKAMKSLQVELKLATEAEEKSKKAMDEMASVLQEVAMDSNQVKEKLTITNVELEAAKAEIEELNDKLDKTEEKYKTLLQEAKQEAEILTNTTDRLKLEAEESLSAWNGKEEVFVKCLKRADEDRTSLIEENNRILQALLKAEDLNKKAKEENYKLRDILKQAVNEANLAKEAAAISRADNLKLKEKLSKNEDYIDFLVRENENLKCNESASFENIKELQRLLAESTLAYESLAYRSKINEDSKISTPNPQSPTGNEENQINQVQTKNLSHQSSMEKEKEKETEKEKDKVVAKTLSLNLKELNIVHKHNSIDKDISEDSDEYSDSELDLFKGSIFDVAETPQAAVAHHRKRSSIGFSEDCEYMNAEDFDRLVGQHLGLPEGERNSRKKNTLYKRFGSLLYRKSSHKKDSSVDKKDSSLDKKEPTVDKKEAAVE